MISLQRCMGIALLLGASALPGQASANQWFTCPAHGQPADATQARVCADNRHVESRRVQIAPPAAGRTWLKCADEGRECRFRGKQRVAFGAKGKWVYGLQINGVMCGINAFGKDPFYGVPKACYIEVETPDGPRGSIDPSWGRCSGENGFCNFAGERRIVFGARGKWAFRIARNGIQCNTATFGDPINGVVKGCYVDPNY